MSGRNGGILTVADVVKRLSTIVGPTLTTAIGGARDTEAIRLWIAGAPCRRSAALQAALVAAAAIEKTWGAEAARNWLCSANPNLDGNSPLVFLRAASREDEFDRVAKVGMQDAQ